MIKNIVKKKTIVSFFLEAVIIKNVEYVTAKGDEFK